MIHLCPERFFCVLFHCSALSLIQLRQVRLYIQYNALFDLIVPCLITMYPVWFNCALFDSTVPCLIVLCPVSLNCALFDCTVPCLIQPCHVSLHCALVCYTVPWLIHMCPFLLYCALIESTLLGLIVLCPVRFDSAIMVICTVTCSIMLTVPCLIQL